MTAKAAANAADGAGDPLRAGDVLQLELGREG